MEADNGLEIWDSLERSRGSLTLFLVVVVVVVVVVVAVTYICRY